MARRRLRSERRRRSTSIRAASAPEVVGTGDRGTPPASGPGGVSAGSANCTGDTREHKQDSTGCVGSFHAPHKTRHVYHRINVSGKRLVRRTRPNPGLCDTRSHPVVETHDTTQQ
jgi:hypothetical protein